MVKKYLLKMIVKALKAKKENYIQTVTCGKETYIVSIYKYVSPNEELREWKNALDDARASD